jgi:hypothetical protein
MKEIQSKAVQIIEKPYKDWMVRRKAKIRYNLLKMRKERGTVFVQSAEQATKIQP